MKYLRNAKRNARLMTWFLSSEYWQSYEESILSGLGYSDPDRASRVYTAAVDGDDGSFTCEIIEDWRDAVSAWELDTGNIRIANCLWVHIDEVELWHSNNGSLDT